MKRFYLFLLLFLFTLTGCKSSILDDPTTVIQFSVPEDSYVNLTIENNYNTIIKTFYSGEEKDAGTYQVTFDANNLAEGVYYYTVELRGVNSNFYSKTTRYLLLIK
jgi:hypothetical protein